MGYVSADKHSNARRSIICYTSINLVLGIVMALYFYKMFMQALQSPACYASEDQDTPIAAGGTDVSALFRNWLKVGLVVHIVYALNSAAGIVSALVSRRF